MQASEINFIVKNVLIALDFYERIFDVERIEVGDFILGQNEVAIKLSNIYLRLLDENPDYRLFAPDAQTQVHSWFNIIVDDIEAVFDKALQAGAEKIQDIQHLAEIGAKNAMFKDPFGYVWLIHQVIEFVDYDTRIKLLEEQGFQRIKA